MKPLDAIFSSETDEPHWKDARKTPEERALVTVATGWINPVERGMWYPAARCRECNVVTWKTSISGGRRRTHFAHVEGCSQPPGRFDK